MVQKSFQVLLHENQSYQSLYKICRDDYADGCSFGDWIFSWKSFQIGDKVRDPKTGCEGEIIDIDGDMYQIKSEQNAKRINNDGYECPLTFWCKETDFVKGHYPDYF